ncbi:flavodoxin family protein [Candidatus Kaiserbacteria bacterium]|nr:flavodoxin family protein [Candidatus Kaiserbacteria bacterium]
MGFFSDHSKKKKIVLLLGHPNPGATLSSEMALIYETAAKKEGHDVRRFNLAELKFDPILHLGYTAIQELEPDLKTLQEAIKWADHFVIVYPNWWQTMPALLKGLFDRMWLPGFSFNMRKHSNGTLALGWRKRLKGKTARVIVLSGSPPWFIWLFFGDYTNEIKMGILWFAGFKTRVTRLGPTDIAPEWMKNGWRREAGRLGKWGE